MLCEIATTVYCYGALHAYNLDASLLPQVQFRFARWTVHNVRIPAVCRHAWSQAKWLAEIETRYIYIYICL